MHPLYDVISNVNKTHQGLGNAMVFTIICIKARQCLLLVSPSGCGKSVITDCINEVNPNAVQLLSVTRARLTDFIDTFSNFFGTVLMDDIASAGSTYERKDTLLAFAVLCYSHAISKHTWTTNFEITNFHGAAVLNIQPALLAEVYEFPEWESLIREKTLRYYHLYRPTKPESGKPKFYVDWGIDVDLVQKPRYDYKLYPILQSIATLQWSDARTLEHLDMLLKAVAALDRRQTVINADLQLLYKLMKPMTIERYIMHKTGFEVGRWMDTNLCAVLVEYASWRNVNIDRIARDYKISSSTVYHLLSNISEWFKEDTVRAKMLVPKPELKRVLREAGVER